MTRLLTDGINGRTYMTYGARHRNPEGRAAQLGAHVSAAARRLGYSRRSAGPGVLHFSAPGLSLSRTSAAVEAPRPGRRRQDVVHHQALPQSDRAAAELCGRDRAYPERDREPRRTGRVASRGRAWLTGRRISDGRYGWTINLIGCWRKSWHRRMKFSCRTGSGRRFEAVPDRPRTIRSC